MRDRTGDTPGQARSGARIAFSIPGEIDDGFLSQIAMFARALRRLPPPAGTARILAYLGCDPGQTVPARWRPHLRGVEIRPVVRGPADGAVLQARARFAEDDPGLDTVILCDADTLPLGAPDAALAALAGGAPVAGVIAHGPPPHFRAEDWNALARDLTGRPLDFPHAYTLWQAPTEKLRAEIRAPFYLNHGFVAFRADALREFHAPYLRIRAALMERLALPVFAGQMAVPLTLNALGWRGAALPMRYNFPNDDRALARHPAEAADIRHLHFLRETTFRRSEIFARPDAFARFLDAAPGAADRPLHAALLRLTGGDYPF